MDDVYYEVLKIQFNSVFSEIWLNYIILFLNFYDLCSTSIKKKLGNKQKAKPRSYFGQTFLKKTQFQKQQSITNRLMLAEAQYDFQLRHIMMYFLLQTM